MGVPKNDLFRSNRGVHIHGDHQVNDPEQCVKCGLDRISPIDGHVAVKDFLEYIGVRNQSFSTADQRLDSPLSIHLMGMSRTDQIHRNVGVNQNQFEVPEP